MVLSSSFIHPLPSLLLLSLSPLSLGVAVAASADDEKEDSERIAASVITVSIGLDISLLRPMCCYSFCLYFENEILVGDSIIAYKAPSL